jgi:diaminohydroxyphosphoribosylaminopyrimidine deaminase / 5-amino-6-(5-phosphoribosylamino)uracil reductase
MRFYDGPFHLWPVPADSLPAIGLVFVQSSDGNTGTENPGDLGGGETDKHLIYEGLSRVAANGVLGGATTAAGPDVFFSIWHPDLVALRRELGLPRHPAQIVVTGRGCIDAETSLIFNVPEVPVFVLGSALACAAIAQAARTRPWVHVLPLEPHGLRVALSRLRLEYGIERISAIGGRTTATALIDEGVVQDVCLTTGNRKGGEPGTPWYSGKNTLMLDRIVSKRGTDQPILFEHLVVSSMGHLTPGRSK